MLPERGKLFYVLSYCRFCYWMNQWQDQILFQGTACGTFLKRGNQTESFSSAPSSWMRLTSWPVIPGFLSCIFMGTRGCVWNPFQHNCRDRRVTPLSACAPEYTLLWKFCGPVALAVKYYAATLKHMLCFTQCECQLA